MAYTAVPQLERGDREADVPSAPVSAAVRHHLLVRPYDPCMSVIYAAAGHGGYGFSVTFCTRQFVISPTSSWFSLRQSSELASPNSFGSLPAEPNRPTTVPSRRTL